MIIQELENQKLIDPPKWLSHSVQYLVMGGSVAYGMTHDASDTDCIGWCIPDKISIFPHLGGEIQGFGRQKQRFEQFISHGISYNKTNYDLTVFSIVKFFHLTMEGNPNVQELLFVPQDCILHMTQVGQLVRENRKLFIHKGLWPKYKGYAFSQLSKMGSKHREGKRKETYDKYGYDVKFAAHLCRLLGQAEELLTTGDLNLRRNSDHLKSIRKGEVSEEDVKKWAANKELYLEQVYHESKLPWGPPESEIKDLLLKCLESHYGSLDKCVERIDKYQVAFDRIKEIVDNV